MRNARFRGLNRRTCRLLAAGGFSLAFSLNVPVDILGTSSGAQAAAPSNGTCTPKYDCPGDPFDPNKAAPAPPPPRAEQPQQRQAPPPQPQRQPQLACGGGAAGGQGSPARVALVIGELAYKNNVPRLTSPGKDADLVAGALRADGFNVTVKCNLDRTQILAEVRNLRNQAASADAAVIYFAGHALSDQGNANYIVPIDADLQALPDLNGYGVSLDTLAEAVGQAKTLQLVILDGCRENLLLPGPGGGVTTRCFSPADYKDRRVVAFSAGSGSVVKDAPGPSSYAAALAENLKKPGLELKDVFDAVAVDVQTATNGSQGPQLYRTSLSQPFFFVPQACEAREEGAWDLVRGSTDPAQFENFLKVFPNGCHAKEGKDKIASLVPKDPSEAAWNVARNGDLTILKAFAGTYPNSSHAPEANQKIAVLEEAAAWADAADLPKLQAFIGKYPNSTHKAEAAAKLAMLEEARDYALLPSNNDPQVLKDFLGKYANSPHKDDVNRRIAAGEVVARLAVCPVNIGPGAVQATLVSTSAPAAPGGPAPASGSLGNVSGSDLKWTQECLGRLQADVGRTIQQAREAEAKAREKAAAGREAQAKARAAAEQAREAEKMATAPMPPDGVVVQDFTKQKLGTYKGGLVNGVRQGSGVWVDVSGERYEGEWKGDGRNGVGKTIPGRMGDPTFEGTWQNGNPCGVGVLIWPNGDRYEGDYCTGHYSGYGIFYFSTTSNTNYARENIGQWANDKQTGYGVRLWAGQNRSEGQWVDGELVGYGAEFGPDGQIQTKLNVMQEGLYEAGILKTPLSR